MSACLIRAGMAGTARIGWRRSNARARPDGWGPCATSGPTSAPPSPAATGPPATMWPTDTTAREYNAILLRAST
jgi:hypothetical protein